MKQIRFVISFISVALVMASCSDVIMKDAVRLPVTFETIAPSSTKAGPVDHESDVASLDLLVFRSDDGGLDTYVRSTEVNAVTGQVNTVSGMVSSGVDLDWFVVANAPVGAFDSIVAEGQFLSSLSRLDHLTAYALPMCGSGCLAAATAALPTVHVDLRRYGCKVSISELVFERSDVFGFASDVKIGRVGLVNVCGSTPYSMVPAAGDLWYNRQSFDPSLSGILADATCETVNMPLSAAGTVDLDRCFYCMPNPVDNGVDSSMEPSWSPRNTRLVVELVVDGVSEWYPVELPAMFCNRHYVLNRLTVTGPGAVGPDYPVVRDEVIFDLEILDWGEVSHGVDFGI